MPVARSSRRASAAASEVEEPVTAKPAPRSRSKGRAKAVKEAPAADAESEAEAQVALSKPRRAASVKKAKDEADAVVEKEVKESMPSSKAASSLAPSASSRGMRTWFLIAVALGVLASMMIDPPFKASQQTLDRPALLEMARRSRMARNGHTEWPLQGLLCVVTGATSGLGKATATELYGLGATVVLPSRSRDKCAAAERDMRAEYPSSAGRVDCSMRLDLASFDSVDAFAESYSAQYQELHVLINNAGMHYVSSPKAGAMFDLTEPQHSEDGWDLSFQSNYMGHFLLTDRLLPLMQHAENISPGRQTRIINVASSYHLQADGRMLASSSAGAAPEAARADINTFVHRNRAYSNSKLAQVLHAKELQKRVREEGREDTGIRVNSICPAWVKTGILPPNAGGDFVGNRAFSPKAASLIALGAVLKNDIQGGDFVAIFRNFFTMQPWSSSLFAAMTWLRVRDMACNVLSMYILARQGSSYGVHVQPSSPEAEDIELQKSLFDWTRDVLSRRAAQAEGAAAAAQQAWRAASEKSALEASRAERAQTDADADRAKAAGPGGTAADAADAAASAAAAGAADVLAARAATEAAALKEVFLAAKKLAAKRSPVKVTD